MMAVLTQYLRKHPTFQSVPTLNRNMIRPTDGIHVARVRHENTPVLRRKILQIQVRALHVKFLLAIIVKAVTKRKKASTPHTPQGTDRQEGSR